MNKNGIIQWVVNGVYDLKMGEKAVQFLKE